MFEERYQKGKESTRIMWVFCLCECRKTEKFQAKTYNHIIIIIIIDSYFNNFLIHANTINSNSNNTLLLFIIITCNIMFQSKPKIDPAYAISIGCVEVSLKCHAAAIIVVTTTGLSAKIIARYRPRCPVLAIVRHGKCARKISTWRNLFAIHYTGKFNQ